MGELIGVSACADAERAATVKTLQEALTRAEAGDFVRVAVVAVLPDGSVMQAWSEGRHRFTMVGALVAAALDVSRQGEA